MHVNESFGQNVFSNGHVYASIKIWELTSSTFCDYKNFEKHRKWMDGNKRKFKKFQRRSYSGFLKIARFSTPLISPKVQVGLNEPQIIRFHLSVKKHKNCFFLYQKRIWETSREFSQYNIKIEICFDRKCFLAHNIYLGLITRRLMR